MLLLLLQVCRVFFVISDIFFHLAEEKKNKQDSFVMI